MATVKKASKKKLIVARKRETVREKAVKSAQKDTKVKRTRKLTSSARKPIGKISKFLGKEPFTLTVPTSRIGRKLNKRARIFPSYFTDSLRELRNVTWPSRKTVLKLTTAVVIFSIAITTLVHSIDLGFDWVFKNIVLK